MRIVVCVKEVLDPSAVNNLALAGRLKIGADGRTLDVAAVPRLINGYDEQALEVALRVRDAGVACKIVAVSVGGDQQAVLRQCAALGADEIVAINPAGLQLDGEGVAKVLAAYIKSTGGADLVLCGRQASDDDQGVTPVLLAEKLGMPAVLFARALEVSGQTLSVTRVTSDGDEVVQGAMPALVTVSNEVGVPRFPSAKAKMAARKMTPVAVELAGLGLSAADLAPSVELVRQQLPVVNGDCEFLQGSAAETARQLIERLRAAGVV
ncbi:MAG: electron transfer flavoprotein subunit beta/FixA family protein [Steroidobacteraceae bacterium]|jgi:electron transfer flavoprotein beta subunit|nr:electron transfer flavoprotein subunit beta/FixA family protein [Steroidobacteraceae bacterium]